MSPQHVLISYAGEVKILDFGIARAAFQADTKHRVVRGKYAYMSPEQVEGQTLDGRSDMFSLGIVLYEMMTGRRLFKMKKREDTLARVRRAEVPSPRTYRPEISEDLEGFLLRALSRNRDDRFEDGQEMYAALTRIMVRGSPSYKQRFGGVSHRARRPRGIPDPEELVGSLFRSAVVCMLWKLRPRLVHRIASNHIGCMRKNGRTYW